MCAQCHHAEGSSFVRAWYGPVRSLISFAIGFTLGELNHRGTSYPGAHQAIIDVAVFEAVQTKLTGNRNGFRQRRSSSDALLLGRVFDDRGNRMTPSYAIKKGVRYRYYTSCDGIPSAGLR